MGDEFTKSWRFEGWLDAYQLNRNTVLDYFRHSEFYDRTCNNETALMQQFDHTKLKLMTGIEYQVDTSINDPSYFLISKQYRESPKIVKTLVLYYIVGQDPLDQTGIKRGTVFPLPDMYSVFRYNMESALYYVNSAFEELADNISYEVGQPYTWDFSNTTLDQAGEAEVSTVLAATATDTDEKSNKERRKYGRLVDDSLGRLMKAVRKKGGR